MKNIELLRNTDLNLITENEKLQNQQLNDFRGQINEIKELFNKIQDEFKNFPVGASISLVSDLQKKVINLEEKLTNIIGE